MSKNRRIMITCAGSQHKWNNHLGVPSHLVTDKNGETILGRTLRQVRERGYGVDEILVFHPEVEGYFLPGNTSVVVSKPGQYLTEFHTTESWWLEGSDQQNIMLLGDTWFTDEAMDTILGYEGYSVRFFGRTGPSTYTGTQYGELFGYAWRGLSNTILQKNMATLEIMKRRGELDRFCGWEMLYYLQNDSVQRRTRRFQHRTDSEFFTEINDYTDDLDFAADHLRHPMFGD